MQAEIEALTSALEDPMRPVAAIVGGAKISTKLDLLGNLTRKVDAMILGGGMANTFLLARGVAIGKSLCERDMADTAREIMAEPRKKAAPSCCRSTRASPRNSRRAPRRAWSRSTRCRTTT